MPAALRNGQVPPGGFVYTDADGVKHEDQTLDGLASRITGYRRANQFPVGDPLAEVTGFFCTRWPGLCTRNSAPAPRTTPTFTARVQTWIANRYARVDRQGLPKVGSREANLRANICAGCALNSPWNDPCKPCEADYRRRAFIIRAGETVSKEERLGACALIGQCNKTAVWLEEPIAKGPLPPHCWRALGEDRHD